MVEFSREWLYWCLMNGVPAAIATVLFLVWPRFARDHFAWVVGDRQSAIFFGTGFLLRAALFVHIATASSWHEVEWMVWGNAVFAVVLLGVTMIYGDFFKWSRPIAIIWLFLYIEEPVWMFTLVPEARAASWPALANAPLNSLLQAALWLEAVVMLVVGVYLYFIKVPDEPIWPWYPDIVSAKIMAGFPLAWAVWAPTLALSGSWAEARGGVALNLVWLGAMLASLAVFRSRFDFSRREMQAYAGALGALFLLLAVGYGLQL